MERSVDGGLHARICFRLAAHGTGERLRSKLKKGNGEPVDSVQKPAPSYPFLSFAKEPNPTVTLLHVACVYGNPSCVETLLELGASPFVCTPARNDIHGTKLGKQTCMHLAAASSSDAVVNLLQAAGLDVNARSDSHSTPLMAAADRHSILVQWTTTPGEDRGKKFRELAPLQEQKSPAVHALIASGADMDAKCGKVERPMLEIGKMIPLSRQNVREKVAIPFSDGMTALHWAVCTGDYGVAQSLVAAGADVNAKTSLHSLCGKHQTPLHFAVEYQDLRMVKLLLAGGADVNAKDAFSVTPLHQVFAASEESFAQLCFSTGSSLSTVLHSLRHSRAAIAEVLLHAGVDRNAMCAIANSPSGREHVTCSSLQQEYEDITLICQLNLNSGGPEVLELLVSVWAQPCSLQSACQFTIRKSLPRPILHPGNVDRLPLPRKLQSYIAMDYLKLNKY